MASPDSFSNVSVRTNIANAIVSVTVPVAIFITLPLLIFLIFIVVTGYRMNYTGENRTGSLLKLFGLVILFIFAFGGVIYSGIIIYDAIMLALAVEALGDI
jgi:hypothetical protein